VLEHILCCDGCDVDPQNRIDKATPLHLSLEIKDPQLRYQIVESLLEAGADTRIKDKRGYTILDLLGARDEPLRQLIRRSQAQASIARDDIANDDDVGGSGSDSE